MNFVGSFTGVVWRLIEDWGLEKLEEDNAFEDTLKVLYGNFATDQTVQLPSWSWSAHLPMFLGGCYGAAQTTIIEALGVTMDFAMKRIRIKPGFCLKTAEPDIAQRGGHTLRDFEQEERGFVCAQAGRGDR